MTSQMLNVSIIETDAGSINFGIVDYIGGVPSLIHHVVGCDDHTVTLDNQSKWSSSHLDMIKNWRAEDPLYLTQNQAFFSVHPFALVNPRLQKAVPVSLVAEPLPMENKMSFIMRIDPQNDVVTLSNGKDYIVYPHDHGTLRKFKDHDRIILGFNSSEKIDETNLDYYKYCLLINTTCNSYVRANPA